MKACLLLIAALGGILCLTMLQSFQGTATAYPESPALTYSHETARVTIPYQAPHAGAGQLTVEVLDPDDHALARAVERLTVGAGKGQWQQDLRLTKPMGVDDLAWQRLRYSFSYDAHPGAAAAIEGTESISQILRMPVVHILGQQSYLSGGQAAVRVIVTDSKNERILGASSVRIELAPEGRKARVLFTGRMNARGTAEAQFRFPAGLVGTYPLHYVAETPIGAAEFTQQVLLEDKVSILLTTEKPIYQPGQTIHVRALALDRAHHDATADRKLTFEVEDSRGNKVFKKVTQTDKFGIASAEFALADEVNLGTYHLRAVMGEPEAATNTAELALNVERYVVPKFKVAVDLAGKDNHAKRGYRPGDHVTGTVRANYFFGKPVDSAQVEIKASGVDVAQFEAVSAQGKTDPEGAYRFDLRLPDYFAGRPLSHGAVAVLIEATVKDAAGHAETRGQPITVSESPLIVTAVPEGGTLVPDLENQIFVIAAYPDGTPAVATVKVHTDGNAVQSATTDEGGVAIVRLRAGVGRQEVRIDASDKEGNQASRGLQLEARAETDQVLLRTEHAVYRAGDRIALQVFSTKNRGTAYVDVVKEGQTVLTRDLDIVNGQASLALTATPDMAGTVDIHAYLFGQDSRPVGDHRLVFVQPADELKIEATADAPTHKPGDDARIRFRVTNGRGEGVEAALGLQVVDEAVFALAEKQPGMAKVFFYLEQEAMKPRYEIHSLGMPEIVEPVPLARAEQHDRAARALFSATEMVNGNKFETEFGRTTPLTKYAENFERYQQHYRAQLTELAATFSTDCGAGLQSCAGSPEPALRRAMRDAWGTTLRLERLNWVPQKTYYEVRSAGPDKQFDTADDLTGYLEVLRGPKPVGRPAVGASRIDFNIEHDRGPFNGRAEMTGTIADQQGEALEGATVTVGQAPGQALGLQRPLRPPAPRSAWTNTNGQFTLSALPPGDYDVKVSNGSETVSRRVTLQERDRAVLSAVIRQTDSGSKVIVANEPPRRIVMGGNARFRNVDGGVVGGIIGERFAMAPPAPKHAAQAAMAFASASPVVVGNATVVKTKSAEPAAHVRSYFPEALYINPEIVTDHNGTATITIPLADSITTWRMAMLASTTHGALGSGVSSLKVFQDFFVDLDLPVTLTQGDRVSIPVAVYNYSAARGDVRLELKKEDWFALPNDNTEKTVAVDAGRVGASQFTLEAQRIGKFKLTLAAHMNGGNNPADIVVREIEVVPNGSEQNVVFNGRLETAVEHDVSFPPMAIADAGKIFVRLYPGPLSQVVEGMDAILRMPFGCFEQTSSATYPNVLALDYMKRTKKLTPEVHAKAEGFIANGYQRLLTFEVPGGGFSWFGNAPANKILTAYGLMEFSDMSHVHDVDAKLIERTQQWLAGQQQADGSWKPDANFINEGATNRYNNDVLRITAYLAWSLANTGYKGPAVDRAKEYVAAHLNGKVDAYTLAVVANFAVEQAVSPANRDFTSRAIHMLLDARTEKDEQAWWTAEETGVYGRGASAAVETTGLAVQALLKSGEASGTASKALRYIASKKDAAGTWGTTQATIMALRALLLSTDKSAADVHGTVEVSLNGKLVQKLVLTPENNDLLHQFVWPAETQGARVALRFAGKGGLAYQIVGRYFVPWPEKPADEPLSIDVKYDRTRLSQDDIATATATVKNNLHKTANMVMVDLGIPPGFDLLSEDLQAYLEKSRAQKSGRLEKFSLTATQAILYFDAIGAGDAVTLPFRLRAKYPIRARTFQSRVYEYYDPAISAVARPVVLEVRKR
jgi:uncharacterized protein YfaS (alpha-2-macroglobulin family)